MESLSFDSPVETDIVRRFPMSASAGTRSRDLTHGNRTTQPLRLQGQEKRKYKKIWKSKSKEKVVSFSSALFPHKNETRGSHPRWNQGNRPPQCRGKKELVPSKVGRKSKTEGAL